MPLVVHRHLMIVNHKVLQPYQLVFFGSPKHFVISKILPKPVHRSKMPVRIVHNIAILIGHPQYHSRKQYFLRGLMGFFCRLTHELWVIHFIQGYFHTDGHFRFGLMINYVIHTNNRGHTGTAQKNGDNRGINEGKTGGNFPLLWIIDDSFPETSL